jgi:hypothetical protein
MYIAQNYSEYIFSADGGRAISATIGGTKTKQQGQQEKKKG